jgi:HrpA-like RNA helicase
LLGLVDQSLKLTNNGNHVSKLSVPICSGLMILKSIELGCWHEAITNASMIEVEKELVCCDDIKNWSQNINKVNKHKENFDYS